MTKVVNYKVNGSGRDTYIGYGNGGFYKTDSLHTEESFYQLNRQNSLPIINSKFKLYHTDGTGRDSYISESQGGFYSYQPKINFLGRLRHYDPSPEAIRGNDFLRRSQMVKPAKEQERQLKQSAVVEQVTQRLQLPKIKRE
ncbi:unnamed protein product [Paramecium sonneborni]|uniref:Uncharacterized protein n=1 Tax=Paramecium sonneborni TaxID=65129 RepID=A0A8S1R0M1_9CILI|nr:unnamed protein product [Paramecium sonneborni]